jgi:hypothetical protein
MHMRKLPIALLIGAATIALAGVAGLAQAKKPDSHAVTVRLSDGAVAQIRYVGDIAPQVIVQPEAAPVALLAPFGESLGVDAPFSLFDRISAEMDRRMATLLGDADAMAAASTAGFPDLTDIDQMAPGSQSFFSVSTQSGAQVCTRSVEVTAAGAGQAPKVIRRAAGDCASAPAGPAQSSTAHPGEAPGSIQVRYGPGQAPPRTPSPFDLAL